MLALTAIRRSFTRHRVLAVTLAAVLSHYGATKSFLETRQTRTGKKRNQGYEGYPYCPQAMCFASVHCFLLLLSNPYGPVNP